MVQLTEAQLLAWITPLLWPFLRVLALFSALPVIGQRSVPARVRVALAFLIAFCAQAGLPEMPAVPLDSGIGFMLVAQQVLIGLTLGFAVRIVFAAVEFAGELMGLQMGLNLAGFFDPATGGQATAVSRFFGIMVSWMFIVIGGHLLIIDAVIQSFRAFPAGPEPFAFIRAMRPEAWGAEIFSIGLWIAMPLVGIMLFVNLVLGLISRVASQMNIFAIGFPITLGVGLIGIVLTLPMMQTPFTMALEKMLERFQ
ncbi:flagellar biosynthetic protein FliR [uncultured Aquincola sp.]|uniref:flagellar biosynthetic protein FliR n=1 Tax=uncultured Aquincola sp. TaxID=886556 RepID=UPI0032B22D67